MALPKIAIEGSWGEHSPDPEIIKSFVQCYLSLTQRKEFPDILIRNKYGNDEYPMVYFEETNGSKVITLNTEGGLLWSQIAYQLSHELTHIHANFSLQRLHKHKWFEESLCELGSITNLYRIADFWSVSKAPITWRQYANSFRTYADNLKKNVAQPEQFSAWLSDNIATLEANSINRPLNKVVAFHLMPLFSKHPSAWLTVAKLNNWECNSDATFQHYLSNWFNNAGNTAPVVSRITAKLGYVYA